MIRPSAPAPDHSHDRLGPLGLVVIIAFVLLVAVTIIFIFQGIFDPYPLA